MKQIGNICILDDERIDEDPYFVNKAVILFSHVPNPESVWPGDKRMNTYFQGQKTILVALGLLNETVLDSLKDSRGCEEFAVEFPTVAEAKVVFEKMMDAGIVDIYLYDDEKLVQKYD